MTPRRMKPAEYLRQVPLVRVALSTSLDTLAMAPSAARAEEVAAQVAAAARFVALYADVLRGQEMPGD